MFVPLALGPGTEPVLISDSDLTRGFKLNAGEASPVKDYVFEDAKIETSIYRDGNYSSNIIMSNDDLMDHMDVDGSLSVSYGLISGSGKGHFMKSRVMSKRKISLLYKAQYFDYFTTPKKLVPTKESELLGAEKREELYGTHFIHKIVYGAQLEVKYTLTSDEDTDLQDLAAELKGSIGVGMFKLNVKGDVNVRKGHTSSNYSLDIKVQYCGVKGPPFPANPSFEQVEKLISKFNKEYKYSRSIDKVGPVGFILSPIADHVHGVFDEEKHIWLRNQLECCGKTFQEALYWDARLSTALEEFQLSCGGNAKERIHIVNPYKEKVRKEQKRLRKRSKNCIKFNSMSVDEIINQEPPEMLSMDEEELLHELIGEGYLEFNEDLEWYGFIIDNDDGKKVPHGYGKFHDRMNDKTIALDRWPEDLGQGVRRVHVPRAKFLDVTGRVHPEEDLIGPIEWEGEEYWVLHHIAGHPYNHLKMVLVDNNGQKIHAGYAMLGTPRENKESMRNPSSWIVDTNWKNGARWVDVYDVVDFHW